MKPGNMRSAPVGNPLAWISFGLSITTFLLFLLFLYTNPKPSVIPPPWLWMVGIAALIFGHLSQWKIGATPHAVKGGILTRSALWIGYISCLFLPMLSLIVPASYILTKGDIARGSNNCRQIITALKVWAEDHNGEYPDSGIVGATNSNDVFRLLFVDEIMADERIFGCPKSPFVPDGNAGSKPDFLEALKPGENHWSLTQALKADSPASYPVVFENSLSGGWDQVWNTKVPDKEKPGRVWEGNYIIIGLNDGSVQKMKVNPVTGKLLNIGDANNQFTVNKVAPAVLAPLRKR